MPQKQVFVKVAGGKSFFARSTVEQALPLKYLTRHGVWQGWRWVIGRPRLQPLANQIQLPLAQPGQSVRHARQGPALGMGVELTQMGAAVVSAERKIKVGIRQHWPSGQRVRLLERQAAPEYAGSQLVLRRGRSLVQHCIESFGSPLGRSVCIDAQACQRRLAQTQFAINAGLAHPPGNAVPTAQFELARCVVTTVANHAAAIKNGFDVALVAGHDSAGHEGLVMPGEVSRAISTVEHIRHQAGTTGERDQQQGNGRQAHGRTSIKLWCHPRQDDCQRWLARITLQPVSYRLNMLKYTARILMPLVLAWLTVFSAQAQTINWIGINLQFTPLSGSTCRITVDRAYLQGSGPLGTIRIQFRNRGTAPVRITALVELQGSGQSLSGLVGPAEIPHASTANVAAMRPFGGSLEGTRLTVKLQSCLPAN